MINERKSERGRKYKAQKHSVKQESLLAQELKGSTTRGSGNKYEKGDVCVPKLARVEAKATEKKSFSITREMVTKLRDARQTDEIPFFQVDLLGESNMRMVVIEHHYLLELIDRIQNGI